MIHLPDYEAFIFDMDGVLIDSEHIYAQMEQENFRQLGLHISKDEHQSYQGTATDEMWKTIKRRYQIPHSVDELVEMTNKLTLPVFSKMEKIIPMPGVITLLEKLKSDHTPLALASSSFPDVISLVVEKAGISGYFDVIVNSRQAGKSKPAPDVFLLAAGLLGIEPGKCIVIEDSANGIAAAKQAGMYCIAFKGPGSEFQDQSGADVIISGFGEIFN